ncbi:S8 family peptidase [Micromonospora sp. NBC_01739]|uniref:S8 family peptidase n=1 Tax=unclassified Micromonospora TaxID=2617518 RepID=UPI002E124110|nr:S8 family peptidase [Micromonospora sp. NBC_01739]
MDDARKTWRRRSTKSSAVAIAAALLVSVAASPVAAAEGSILGIDNPNAIPDSYLVVLKDDSAVNAQTLTRELTTRYDVKVAHTYSHALNGFAGTMSHATARRLAAQPGVAYVEQDIEVRLTSTQVNPPSWGLDRIDQRHLPLDNTYTYPDATNRVRAYVIDTGIRTTHADFGGRAVWGINTTGDGINTDCNGHGTHVAGTLGGRAFGVAKSVSLVAVKVLGCGGVGTTAAVIAGVEWVTAQHVTKGTAVANMSLGAKGSHVTLENAIRGSILKGVLYTISSGNNNSDACEYTPAKVLEAITVNASTIGDSRALFSNWGRCTDIFAPGQEIRSAWYTSDNSSYIASGTSMAAPHVAGAAALILGVTPGLTPQQVGNLILGNATQDKIPNPEGSPNRLLYVGPTGVVPIPGGAPLSPTGS